MFSGRALIQLVIWIVSPAFAAVTIFFTIVLANLPLTEAASYKIVLSSVYLAAGTILCVAIAEGAYLCLLTARTNAHAKMSVYNITGMAAAGLLLLVMILMFAASAQWSGIPDWKPTNAGVAAGAIAFITAFLIGLFFKVQLELASR